MNNGANKDFTDYPLTITLNDNVPPGFTYERAGTDGKDLVFISADGTKQLPYKIGNWNIAVFTAQKDETWLPIDYQIQFRVVGHSPTNIFANILFELC